MDALKRADAERARAQGRLPALQDEVLAARVSQPVVSTFDPQAPLRPAPPPAWARPRVAAALLGGVLLLGLAMLALGPARRAEAPPQPAATAPASPAAPAPTPAPAAAPVRAAQAPKSPPAPAAAAQPAKPTPQAPPAQAAQKAQAKVPAQATKPTAPAQATTPTTPTPQDRAPAGSGAAAAASAPLPGYADLPDTVKAGMPRLVLSGIVYSADPASRMLLVNGQVFREGDAVAAGLVLERIGPRQATFSINGTRFTMRL
ncbi:MAG: general secretion pathway protein GspB [Rubrivivax sp.]